METKLNITSIWVIALLITGLISCDKSDNVTPDNSSNIKPNDLVKTWEFNYSVFIESLESDLEDEASDTLNLFTCEKGEFITFTQDGKFINTDSCGRDKLVRTYYLENNLLTINDTDLVIIKKLDSKKLIMQTRIRSSDEDIYLFVRNFYDVYEN